MSELSGLDYSYISRLEQGKNVKSPRPETLQALAGALDVEAEDFYALAGFELPERLPEFAPYLRAKYDLPIQAVKQLDDYFQLSVISTARAVEVSHDHPVRSASAPAHPGADLAGSHVRG